MFINVQLNTLTGQSIPCYFILSPKCFGSDQTITKIQNTRGCI